MTRKIWSFESFMLSLQHESLITRNMPVKILSVDDEIDLELLLTQYFRRQIRKGEYTSRHFTQT